MKKTEKTCYIFASVPISDTQKTEQLEKDDLVIAADGGYGYLKKNHINPDVVIGDFDSSDSMPTGDFKLLKYPVEKDETDTVLAVRYALSEGYRRIVIYGGLGGKHRSHTVANCQTLSYIAKQGGAGFLVENNSFITVLSDNGKIEFSSDEISVNARFSLFSMVEKSVGVYIKNMKYELENAVVTCDFPIGAGNSFIEGKNASIGLERGLILIVYEE